MVLNSVSQTMANDTTHHFGKMSVNISVDSFGHEEKLANFADSHAIMCKKVAKRSSHMLIYM